MFQASIKIIYKSIFEHPENWTGLDVQATHLNPPMNSARFVVWGTPGKPERTLNIDLGPHVNIFLAAVNGVVNKRAAFERKHGTVDDIPQITKQFVR